MSLVILDTETTGLDPHTEQVFEIAVYNLDTDRTKTWTIEPHPDTIENMHPKAAEVNRYFERTAEPSWQWTVEHYGHGYETKEVNGMLHDLSNWLEGNHVLGAVPDFDARFLTTLYKAFDQKTPRWHYHLIDIEVLAVGYLLRERQQLQVRSDTESWLRAQAIDNLLELPYKSDDLAEFMGVEPAPEVERHTALGDVMWTKRWWEVLNA